MDLRERIIDEFRAMRGTLGTDECYTLADRILALIAEAGPVITTPHSEQDYEDTPERLWLEPERIEYGDEGRLWSQDDVWSSDEDGPGVEYVRADVVRRAGPVMPERMSEAKLVWRQGWDGQELHLGGLLLGIVSPKDDERYYAATSDPARFYEHFNDEKAACTAVEDAVSAALAAEQKR